MSQGAQFTDVFVLGGGPAGLAAAIATSQKGLRVIVADSSCPPIDKACGEGLMPDAVAALRRLGVAFEPTEGLCFHGIRFLDARERLRTEARFSRGTGLALRRVVLHAKLAQRAADAGVRLLWGARATVLPNGEVTCEGPSGGQRIASRWVIGADGEASQVRKWVGAAPPRYEQIRFACRRHFRARPWTDFVEVHWADGCQIVVAPVSSDEICVAVTSRSPRAALAQPENAVRLVPELARRLADAPAVTARRGARTALRRLRRVYRGRFALIGDASGSVDPISGEGLGLAFQQAEALAEAILRDDLGHYQRAHVRIGRVAHVMSRLMLWMDARPRFQKQVLRALAAEPALFARLLDAHVRALAPSDFGLGNALRLGWRVAAAWEAGVSPE